MTLGDFMDVLGKLHKLTPAQRRAVAEVLAEPDEVHRPAEASEPVAKRTSRPHYTEEQRNTFQSTASYWNGMTDKQREANLELLSRSFGRTESQIARMIHKYRTGK